MNICFDVIHQAPIGELLLQGHAGITHASPVDIREVLNSFWNLSHVLLTILIDWPK
jgi:hypothetical protein